MLEWVAILFPRGYFLPRDEIQVSHIAGRFFTIWATREAISIYGTVEYIYTMTSLFICWWTFQLLACLGHYQQSCSGHWGTCISLSYSFLWIYAQEWDCWIRASTLLSIVAAPTYIPANSLGGLPWKCAFLTSAAGLGPLWKPLLLERRISGVVGYSITPGIHLWWNNLYSLPSCEILRFNLI